MTKTEKELIVEISKAGMEIIDWKLMDGHELPITRKPNVDNAVPSLDNLTLPVDKSVDFCHGWLAAIDAVKELQNGVETAKKQPKCINCNHPLSFPNDWCNECGYDQGDIG